MLLKDENIISIYVDNISIIQESVSSLFNELLISSLIKMK